MTTEEKYIFISHLICKGGYFEKIYAVKVEELPYSQNKNKVNAIINHLKNDGLLIVYEDGSLIATKKCIDHMVKFIDEDIVNGLWCLGPLWRARLRCAIDLRCYELDAQKRRRYRLKRKGIKDEDQG
jgi:hypothetical protein